MVPVRSTIEIEPPCGQALFWNVCCSASALRPMASTPWTVPPAEVSGRATGRLLVPSIRDTTRSPTLKRRESRARRK